MGLNFQDTILNLKTLLIMQDGHEEMLLLKRSSRSAVCAPSCSLEPSPEAGEQHCGSAHRAPAGCSECGVAQRQGQEEPPKGLVLPLLLSRAVAQGDVA